MRYALLLILVLMLCVSGLRAGWEMIDNNIYVKNRNGNDVPFLMADPVEINNLVYAQSSSGEETLIYSEDTCMNWKSILFAPINSMGASTRFYDLVKSGTSLFVPADSGRLYRSFDKGKTWDYHLFENDMHPIQHIRFVNENIGYVGMIDKHLLAKTTDGGHTWTPLPLVGEALPDIFSFLRFVPASEDHIIVVGYDLTVPKAKLIFLETTDGGISWHRFESEEFEQSKYVRVDYEYLTYINGNFLVEYKYQNSELGHTSIMKSADFRTWEPAFISDTISGGKGINQLKFYDNIGIGLGLKIFIVSTDYGETWVDLYDEKDTVYFKNSASPGFAYLGNYIYSLGVTYYYDEENIKKARYKIFRYKLDLKTSVEVVLENLNVYPNPAKDEIRISYDKPISSIKIIDINGKKLLNQSNLTLSKERAIDVESLAPGTYFILINDRIYKRFVKE